VRVWPNPPLLLVLILAIHVPPVAAQQVAGGTAETGREAEAAIFARWNEVGPAERMRMRGELDRIQRERGVVEARCVLVTYGDRQYTLTELFERVLDPALETPVQESGDDELGLQQPHRDAVGALVQLRAVHDLPAPVDTAALNLLLGYAQRVLDAWILPPRVRLHLLVKVLENVRRLDGRARPDARTAWIVREGIMPALLGLARRYEEFPPVRDAISESAALLSLPSVLEPAAIAQLASLTSGVDSLDLLERLYRRGQLPDLGVRALVRSIVAEGKDDAAYVAGAAPILLELLGDRRVSDRDRGSLVDLILDHYATVELLRPTAKDLLAAAYGAAPAKLADWRRRRTAEPGEVAYPSGGETFRFLQVVMVKPQAGGPPRLSLVVRADVPYFQPVRTARNEFVGMLVPSASGEHADFLGPTPGLRVAKGNRLIRRTLQLGQLSVQFYGAHNEEIEMCVALPRDGLEPIPVQRARLEHVLDFIRGRLERTQDRVENRALVDLLVQIGTPTARSMAVRYARSAEHASSLLELLEGGDASAAAPLLDRVGDLTDAERPRAFGAVLERGKEQLAARVRELAATAPVDIAAPAADALLNAGDTTGVHALLAHKNRYARLCGAALALRLTELAEGLRIVPNKPVDMAALAKLARAAFPKSMGGAWRQLGAWLPIALTNPDKARTDRTDYDLLFVRKGQPKVNPERFAHAWTEAIKGGKAKSRWASLVPYVLPPRNPGRGMKLATLNRLLDAIEPNATADPVRRAWIDALVVLVAVQSGLGFDTEYLKLADERLRKVAGKQTPRQAARKPGLAWPIWASRDQAGRK